MQTEFLLFSLTRVGNSSPCVVWRQLLLCFNLKPSFYTFVGDPPIYRFWKDTLKTLDQHTPSAVTAQMVETTAYALLTTLLRGDNNYANPIIKWLSEEQRYGGGFYSTQVSF